MQGVFRAVFRALSMIAPGIAARAAERLWFRIPKPKVPDAGRAFLATGEQFTVAVKGKRVSAWRWGSGTGPTILLMHGWGGYGAQFQSIAETLIARGVRVVIFDTPSHGASDAGEHGARYSTLFEFSDTLSEIVRTTPGELSIVAHSGGCAAAAWAMTQHPEWPVRRVVFVAPFARPSNYIQAFQRTLGLSDNVIHRFRARTEAELNFRWTDLEVPEMAERMSHAPPPTLVIHDRGDRETAWQDGADIAAKWPGASLISTTGLGHNRILRDPSVVQSIADFLLTRSRP